MTKIHRWKESVRAHHAQSIRAQGGRRPEDFWRPFAANFREDPRRASDPAIDRLVREIGPGATLLDVGGGAGRVALPLALRCRHVTVVEPSPSMVEALREQAREAKIDNLSIVEGEWEAVRVGPADVVLCSHVLYGIEEVEPFVRKLEAHAKNLVLIIMFLDSPQSHLSPLWRWVHQEERVNLPGLRDLLEVMWEMAIYPDLEMMQPASPQVFETWEKARDELRRRLYVDADSGLSLRLDEAMGRLLGKTPGGFVVRDAQPRRLGLLSWRTGPAVS